MVCLMKSRVRNTQGQRKESLKMARINLAEMLNHEKETQENRGRKFARNF